MLNHHRLSLRGFAVCLVSSTAIALAAWAGDAAAAEIHILNWQGWGTDQPFAISEFEKRTGIKCIFDSKVGKTKLDPDRAAAVFRIFQETLTNIVRHAKATEASIHLRREGDKLVLEVQNNGRGVAGRENSGTRSLDVLGIRERATSLHGEVNIVSGQGSGTLVGVRVPLHRAGELKKN